MQHTSQLKPTLIFWDTTQEHRDIISIFLRMFGQSRFCLTFSIVLKLQIKLIGLLCHKLAVLLVAVKEVQHQNDNVNITWEDHCQYYQSNQW